MATYETKHSHKIRVEYTIRGEGTYRGSLHLKVKDQRLSDFINKNNDQFFTFTDVELQEDRWKAIHDFLCINKRYIKSIKPI